MDEPKAADDKEQPQSPAERPAAVEPQASGAASDRAAQPAQAGRPFARRYLRRRRPGRSGEGHAHGQSRGEAAAEERPPRPSQGARGGEKEGGVPATDRRAPMKREIIANTGFEETRIAVLEGGRLTELFWDRKSEKSIVGNIYKGVVDNVLPGISSAFVDIGLDKNAYLYISDVLGGRGVPIDQTLKKGQHIMVQVAKEAISTKGMKVTMDVTLPGRYLVLSPLGTTVGVSKNIEDAAERHRLSEIVGRIASELLKGKGIVVRTEAEGANEDELKREASYLLSTWEDVQKKFESSQPPALIHKDLDLTLQVARDILSDSVYVYLIDDKAAHKNAVEFVERISPELKDRVRHYDAKTPIFKAFRIEDEIEKLRQTKVPLPNGGSIIIQEAESLCAIDVNTGRFTGSKSQEETVTQTNIEAALETAHQIRLRNIGGIIVVDFIDMRKASNRNRVMEALARAVRSDRAKIRILPITRLGLIEMTRERKRESTVSLITDECPECKGAGRVLSSETLRIRIQREIHEMTAGRPGGNVRLILHPALAELFRSQQPLIERNVHRSIKIQSDPQRPWEDYHIILE